MKNLAAQGTLGLLMALAVAFGIMGRSWQSFFSFFVLFLFFAAWHAASVAVKSGKRGLVAVGYTVITLCGVTVLGAMAAGAEQAYFMNGSTYPSWLATADLGKVQHANDLEKLAYPRCKPDYSIILMKDNGLAAIRCGGFSWLESKTYLAHLETPR